MIHQSKNCCGIAWNLEYVMRCLKCGDVLRDMPCDCEKCSGIRNSVKSEQKKMEDKKYEYF
jgi:hypothetical protein